jgi:hypothetical protein
VDLRDDILENRSIRFEYAEPSDRIVAIVAPSPFSLTPAVITTNDDPARLE